MFDSRLRPLIDPPLNRIGRFLAVRGVSANSVTGAGLTAALLSAAAILAGLFGLALVLLLISRLCDGLDGAVARAGLGTEAAKGTDWGGYFDIVADYVFYGAIPLAFVFHDPARNALPGAVLLFSFILSGTAFLAFAVMAEKRQLQTEAQGAKALYYVNGLAEGFETIAVLVAMVLFPSAFPVLAIGFGVVCIVSALARWLLAWRMFA